MFEVFTLTLTLTLTNFLAKTIFSEGMGSVHNTCGNFGGVCVWGGGGEFFCLKKGEFGGGGGVF